MGGARTGGVRFLSYGVADVFAFPAPSHFHFIGVSEGAVSASFCVVAYSFGPILLAASALTGDRNRYLGVQGRFPGPSRVVS